MTDTGTPDAHSARWYKDGLNFQCTGCGNCCTGEPGVVWLTDEELRAIAEYTGKTIGEVKIFHTRLQGGRLTLDEYANGDCTFFDGATRRCTIYPVRPEQCQTWPFWPSILRSRARWDEVAKGCPGMNSGPLVQLETIEEQANRVDV